MPIESLPASALSDGMSVTAILLFIGDKLYKHLIRGDIFARKSDIPKDVITDANIHEKVSAILEEKKVITLDQCQDRQKDFGAEQDKKFIGITEFNQVNKKLDIICASQKAILRFLAKQCSTPEEFQQLIDLKGD